MAEAFGLAKQIGLQDQQTVEDLPHRWMLLTLVAALSAWFLPPWHVAGLYIGTLIMEVLSCRVARRLATNSDRVTALIYLALTFISSSLFALLMGMIWSQEGIAPKVVAFAGLVSAIQHATVVRSTWFAFGVTSVLPLLCTIFYTVTAHLFANDEWTDALAGMGLLLVMIGYASRSMIATHQARKKIIAARDKAAEASRAKSRFLATMSHEIRTPLNAIHGMTQLLREDNRPDLVEERTALLLKASTDLRSIVDDVLDHSRIEANRYVLRPEPVDPADAVRPVAEAFKALAEAKGLTISFKLSHSVTRRAVLDPLRVRQVVANLTSNAVKYSDAGRVEVRLWAEPRDTGWTLFVSISDQGPGLTEEEVTRLFKAFERIERHDAASVPGTGLGLSIARGFAELMGGQIDVASKPGEGTTFTFRFPAERVADAETALGEENAVVGPWYTVARHPILLVDDNASNRYVVRCFLRSDKAEVIEATNGSEALEQLRSRPFSLVLLDMHMPVLDGPATLAEMRRAGGRIAETPVIALSAASAEAERARCLNLGVASYITKPIRRSELLREIAAVLEERTAQAA